MMNNEGKTARTRGAAVSFLCTTLLIAACGVADTPMQRDLPKRAAGSAAKVALPNLKPVRNDTGESSTFSTAGGIDTNNLFFKSIGTNGRSCASCHDAGQGWTITPEGTRERFEATLGRDPIFRTNDGSNSPNADVSSLSARRAAYSMLLSRGLIRVGIGILPSAEFELTAVDDPYGFASSAELSLFRRPLPSTNLPFISGVMWDGRETFAGNTIHFDLGHQSNDATLGHAQAATALTSAQQEEIVNFEVQLFTAQTRDDDAGNLDDKGALGGPAELSQTPFHIGINDTLGADPSGSPFNRVAMTLFDAWSTQNGNGNRAEARMAVARGESLFNTRTFNVSGVRGLNDTTGLPVIAATCTTCHDTPNVGDHSVSLPLDIGLTDESRRTPDMPLYTLRNKATGELYKTTDPGRALITGRWADRSRFKGPILRALAARAPYFHNGSAATLEDAVHFYETRFGAVFSAAEERDLIAFLQSL
jgi:cytochrome c peroxidase